MSDSVLYHFRTRGSGAEGVHIAGIARAFRRLGYTVDFCSPTGIDPTASAGENPFGGSAKPGLVTRMVDRLPDVFFEVAEVAYNVFAALRLRRHLASGRVSMLYERHAFFLVAGAQAASSRGLQYVVEVNELVGDERIRRQPLLASLARRCDSYVFRKASLIVVVSPHLKRRICDMGVDEAKVLVLPNAVDEDTLASPPEEIGRGAEAGTDGRLTIGFVGWFVHWHRLDLLVEALIRLVRKGRDLQLMLVGDGPLKDELLETTERAGMSDRLILTGAVSHDRIPYHVRRFDVAVIPNSNEFRSPIKLFEYMAEERAVLAPATEPIEMVLEDGRNGVLFQPGSVDDMTEKLDALVRDEEARSALGRQARLDVAARHTWTANARKVLDGLS